MAAAPEVVMKSELSRRSTPQLMSLYGRILDVLGGRDVVRTRNAPTGDYAEWLVAKATRGYLATRSEKSWDVCTKLNHHPKGSQVCGKGGEHLQVKARVVADENRQPALSPFRSWKFDSLVIVLFSDTYEVLKAAKVPRAVVEGAQGRYWSRHVNGDVVYAKKDLLSQGNPGYWTRELREAAN
jgi:hypothetical protein